MVGGTQFSPWQGLRGESGPNWHSTIRAPAAARDKRPDDSPVVFRSAGTGRRGGPGAQHGEGARGHRDHAQSTRRASLRAASCTQICRAVSVQPVPFPVGTPTTHLHPLLEDTIASTAARV